MSESLFRVRLTRIQIFTSPFLPGSDVTIDCVILHGCVECTTLTSGITGASSACNMGEVVQPSR